MYMNYDMVGSPNYIQMVYDADESSFDAPAGFVPDGSIAIEDLYESYYTLIGEPYDDTEFSGRSDYEAFILERHPVRRPVHRRRGAEDRPAGSRSGAAPRVSSSTRATTRRATRSRTTTHMRSRSTATSSRSRS